MAVWSEDITKSIEELEAIFELFIGVMRLSQGCCFFATRAKEYSLLIGYALLIICKSVMLLDVVYLRV